MLLAVLDQSLERSPYFDAAHRDGASSYIVLNHMFMPYRYGDQTAEYWSLVNDVTLWDVAAEKQVEVSGPDATAFMDLVIPRNLDKCLPGHCRYVVLTDADGHVINDPVLIRLEQERYWLSAADSDLALWLKGVACFAGLNVKISEPDVAPIQLQGKKSRDLMVRLFGEQLNELKYYRALEAEIDGMPVVITRTGWSGDLGYEIYLQDVSRGLELWDKVKAAGGDFNLRVTGPNTIRRVEAGIIAMRSDFPLTASPYHLGLDRMVDLNKPVDFIGKRALASYAKNGVKWKLVSLKIEGSGFSKEPAYFGAKPVRFNGKDAGRTTVMVFSPRLNATIGYAQVDAGASELGTVVEVEGAHGAVKATVVERPFLNVAAEVRDSAKVPQ
ncbi:glycine cleavage T C-terminal barrel domain-containing protein [Aestuariivirga sp.]|uniref:glycine cleavage T C-terminal barrel domain-containing protein n=1 Tax=Aestuariivirga sp. TaxID=2650926 RepID=UPI003BA98C39